ncbi:hypothetical protein EIP91_005566 [Steccherinum ochraceum]|uniref:F-box domain-containing protein n=1 Tax=Steccherinum ochraceum TaxID=92696 RepID=A0A4V6N799_9APHY|nr:hypothetical protein EIP91_005566 [Steccherinum ochraceum]
MAATASTSLPWHALPTEMKFSVIDQLALADIRAFSTVNRDAYELCIPAMWRHVDLKTAEALLSYVLNVPASYHRYIRQLTICTKPAKEGLPPSQSTVVADAIATLLSQCSQLEQLELNLECSLHESVVPAFGGLTALKALSIGHCGHEQHQPLSERLVVSMAATVPNLVDLSLSCIARSVIHAPELVGAYPFVPVVAGDANIPDHPLLGAELSLPSLLRLPTLKSLRIRDTHLGDPRWSTTPACCSLQVLDLGSCCHESPEFNRTCTERIVGNVGHSVSEFSLATAISADCLAAAKDEQTPLKRLRKIQLTPLFPVENVVDTLSALSDSPIEQLSVKCHEDDVVDMCSAVEDFLNLRVERGQTALFEHLTAITVDAVADLNDEVEAKPVVSISADHADAVKHLQEYCRDLHLASAPACAPGPKCASDLAPITGRSQAKAAAFSSL